MRRSFPDKDNTAIHITAETIEHMKAHADSWGFLKEAIRVVDFAKINRDLGLEKIAVEVDLGRYIGRSGLVSRPRDAWYQKRLGRDSVSRLTHAIGPRVKTMVVVVLWDDFGPRLITAYIGKIAPYEDLREGSEERFEAEIRFWNSHAITTSQKKRSAPGIKNALYAQAYNNSRGEGDTHPRTLLEKRRAWGLVDSPYLWRLAR